MLILVEALRDYAATHDGKLPETLDQLTGTPVPDDPVTGQLFRYSPSNGWAVIDGPALIRGTPFG